jgi:hypothetical protein
MHFLLCGAGMVRKIAPEGEREERRPWKPQVVGGKCERSRSNNCHPTGCEPIGWVRKKLNNLLSVQCDSDPIDFENLPPCHSQSKDQEPTLN